jgi:hypothetical protein
MLGTNITDDANHLQEPALRPQVHASTCRCALLLGQVPRRHASSTARSVAGRHVVGRKPASHHDKPHHHKRYDGTSLLVTIRSIDPGQDLQNDPLAQDFRRALEVITGDCMDQLDGLADMPVAEALCAVALKIMLRAGMTSDDILEWLETMVSVADCHSRQ